MPWFEWRDDLSREEKAEYLAHLLYRDAGLTLKDATVVPGGVLMSRRTEGDDAPRSTETRASSAGNGVPSSASASMTDAEVDSLFDDIAEDVGLGGMDAFVARVKSDGGNIRVNRTGGVVVEGAEASDEEENKLRNTRFGDRLRSRPGATMGFADGPRNDVAPYGMNLESGGGRKGNRPARGRQDRRNFAGARVNGGGGGSYAASSTRGDGSSSAASRGSSGRLRSSSGANARAASVARRSAGGTVGSGTASPGTGASRGVPVRRRRVRVSVPDGNDAAARGRALGRSSPASRATAAADASAALNAASTGAGSSRAGSASRSASLSIGSLRGVGPGSVAALEGLGVRTIEELAALSDADVADIKSKKPLLKVSSLRKIARRAMEGDGEGK